ncbi:polar amino acid transport system substrate-binding protein [Streptococcus henryi]|uniref:Polar amino acid transport system substrate-binding protein n=1 Tax=Streptococcus henryi TaxID=439219 RepID=A0A1G6B8S1_9STRE|nr:transporter substrate-binding domain-containing protein [Streptococcus henryi]SDB17048.1 polar amino acid transport system substrate-binding protein [Streptococcus henryi]
MTFKKKLWLSITSLVLLTGLVACSSKSSDTKTVTSSTASEEKITVVAATGGGPKPFIYQDGNKLTGHNIELVEAIFDKLPQYDLKIEKVEFSSMFSGLTSGRFQIAVNNLAKNAEREANYLFTDPIFKNSYVVIYQKDNEKAAEADSWTDLAGLSTVGSAGVNSTTAIEEYNKNNPDAQITFNYTAEDLKSQLEGVESGKYDFLVMDKPMFEYYQKEYDLDLVGETISGELETELLPAPYSYLVLAQDQKELVEDINEALKEVVEDGTSKEINLKYFGEDYSPSYSK